MYTFLGEIYDFYKVKMNRDSFNNAGATMRAFVNLPAELAGEKLCPNARWVRGNGPTDNQLQTCPGWNTRDIDAHEFTHGVVEYTANLDFLNQSGALNEAIADVFAMGVDPDDWQLGEDLTIGAIRHVNDPGQNRSANSSGGTSPYPMPDRLFSPLYFCEEGDRGGVHINMTIPTKAFYLMVAGGTFNGCTMTPVARDKVLLVWYQALTKYLGQTSNFRNLYDGMVQGCTELYGATSNECVQIKKSMEAVELDQQPLGEQKAPVCRNVTAAAPSCVGTENPVTPSPNVTGIACSNVEGDATGDGKVNLADYQTWRREFTK
jgi:thermolysin